MKDQNVLFEEYKTLREEIGRIQDSRLVILGFTITAMGAVVGIVLGTGSNVDESAPALLTGIMSFCMIMLIAASSFTITQTQSIDILAGYIRRYLEPELGGLGWESRWNIYRKHYRAQRYGRLPLGASKSFAIYYALLVVSVYGIGSVAQVRTTVVQSRLVSLLAVAALLLTADLYFRLTSGWKVLWDDLDEESSGR